MSSIYNFFKVVHASCQNKTNHPISINSHVSFTNSKGERLYYQVCNLKSTLFVLVLISIYDLLLYFSYLWLLYEIVVFQGGANCFFESFIIKITEYISRTPGHWSINMSVIIVFLSVTKAIDGQVCPQWILFVTIQSVLELSCKYKTYKHIFQDDWLTIFSRVGVL